VRTEIEGWLGENRIELRRGGGGEYNRARHILKKGCIPQRIEPDGS